MEIFPFVMETFQFCLSNNQPTSIVTDALKTNRLLTKNVKEVNILYSFFLFKLPSITLNTFLINTEKFFTSRTLMPTILY